MSGKGGEDKLRGNGISQGMALVGPDIGGALIVVEQVLGPQIKGGGELCQLKLLPY